LSPERSYFFTRSHGNFPAIRSRFFGLNHKPFMRFCGRPRNVSLTPEMEVRRSRPFRWRTP
jgi:hypothetical protein